MNRIERTCILHRIEEEDILSFARKTWQNQRSVAMKMASKAVDVINETYQANPTFFSGKSMRGIIGGLFYVLGHRYGNARTQKEIAQSLNITEMTIRASCRNWIKPFQSFLKREKRKQQGAIV